MSIQDMHERLKKANERRNCGADEEIASLRAANAAKDAEIERLRAEVETQAWNLGGISTLACSRKLVEFDSSMARPALHDVAALVKDYSALASTVPEQKMETCVWKYGIDKDGWDGWYTTCGGFISFSAKRPEGYQQQGYCHFCGRRIEVKK